MPLDYSGKIILAPMVRVGTLPMRLLALDYGADIVYTEIVSGKLGTIDFVEEEGTEPVLRILPQREEGRLVLQIGSCNPERALAVAKLLEDDVAGVDLNMGCPKFFSIQGGMGAALLTKPELVRGIVETLVKGQKNPVTCKIRLLPEISDTLKLCETIQDAGASAIGIHGRRKEERPRDQNRNSQIAQLATALRVPVIANGGSKEISKFEDIERFRSDTKASSVMVARAAMWNPSIFRKEGLLPVAEIIQQYLKYAIRFESNEKNVKYVLQRMLGEEQTTTEKGRALLAATTMAQICRVWGVEDEFKQTQAERREEVEQNGSCNGSDVITASFMIPKKRLTPECAPKAMLHEWCKKNHRKINKYQSIQRPADHKFRCVLVIGNQKFTSSFWERNKRFAENAAAMVALDHFEQRKALPAEFWAEAVVP